MFVCVCVLKCNVHVFACVSDPVTSFLEKAVMPVLLPGLEAMLREAQRQHCLEVQHITQHNTVV